MDAPVVTDAVLWAKSRAHDGEAFGMLFDRHHRAVYAHCLRRLDSVALAEDLVSMTFLEAWRLRRRATLTTDSMRPWLLAIANNLISNQNRTSRRYRRFLERLPTYVERAPSAADEALDAIVAAELSRNANSALQKLRADEQQIVRLAHFDGLSHAEIAATLGIPVGTVKSRLHRAMAALRELLVDSSASTASAFPTSKER